MRKTLISLAVIAGACGSDSDGSMVTIKPGAGAGAELQAALISAKPGTVITLEEGVYALSEELSLSVSGVTITGQPERDKVVLDFSSQTTGNANGFSAEGVTGLVLQNLTIKDSQGDAVRVQSTKDVTLKNLHVYWSAGSATENGAYGIYPVFAENTLIEDCLVEGASDAGIYVGQSTKAVIRGNTARRNVTGIEVENTDDAEVVDNVATDNVSGILVFNLPNLPRKSGSRTKVHGNTIEANNREPFALAGSIVSYVPPGTGMILFANDDTEVHDNTFTGNASTALVLVSCFTVAFLTDNAVDCNDSAYDAYPEGVYLHGNTYTGNGTAPKGFYPVYWIDRDKPLYDIIWDGVTDSAKPNPEGALDLCIQETGATFAQINPMVPGVITSTDLGTHDCTHTPLAGVPVTW